VLRFFKNENNWFLGEITSALPPTADDPADEGWIFHVEYEDGDEADYPRKDIEADILPPGTGKGPGLHKVKDWPLMKKIYEQIRLRLHSDTFDAEDDACIREVFNMREATRLTVQAVKNAYNKKALKCHDDKTRAEPARVRYLSKLVNAAMLHLQQSHQRLADPSHQANDKPLAEDYPEYHSEAFAAAASAATGETVPFEDLTQPPAEDDGDGGDDDDDESDQTGDGSDGPREADGSDYAGEYPDTFDAVNTHNLDTFSLSPFQHVTWIPKGSTELWASAYNIVTKELIAAVNSTGPERTKRIGTAARWYLGLPQLMLRDANRGPKRNAKIIRNRLTLFKSKEYGKLLKDWHFDCEKSRRKMKPPRKDTPERRLEHAIDLFHKGYVSRGLRTLEGNGRASAEDPAIQQQMQDKHPRVEGEEFFDDASPSAE
jgi:hypothetical protein